MTDTPQLSELRITSPALCKETDDVVSGRRARRATAEILASENHNYSNNGGGDNAKTKSATKSTKKAHSRSSFVEQDESVLGEVLAELDRERQKRAELEAKVRVLEQEVHFHRKKHSKAPKTSLRDYTLMKTERDSYKEILDALTQDRPAFCTGSTTSEQQKKGAPYLTKQQQQQQSLPIHVVRLLEVMPWDSRAQQYVFGQEHVYEWQVYSADKKWQKELRYFPTFFKTLPVVVPSPGKIVSDEAVAAKNHGYFGGANVAPPKQCVLTDLEGKTILNIDKGYPLPEDGGGWTWVGPWRVEKNQDTDEQGWAYSNETEIMSARSTYYGEFRVPERGKPNIAKRRRKWTRSRTLIDYPHVSKMTQEYLKLIAEKSRLNFSLDKVSGQLVETKMSLTTLEAEKERTDAQIRELKRNLEEKTNSSGPIEHGSGSKLTRAAARTIDNIRYASDSSLKSTDSTKKVEEIRSAVTQWVSNTVQKQLQSTAEEDTPASANSVSTQESQEGNATRTRIETDSDHGTVSSNGTSGKPSLVTQSSVHPAHQDPKQQLFDSLRDKSTGLLEILKQKGEQLDKIKQGSGGGGVGLPWQRKEEGIGNKTEKDGKESSVDALHTPPKSNVYVPSGRARLSSIGSND